MASVSAIGVAVVGTVHLLYLAIRVVVFLAIVAWGALMVWLWIALVRSRSAKIRAEAWPVDLDEAYLEAAALAAASPLAESSLFASRSDG